MLHAVYAGHCFSLLSETTRLIDMFTWLKYCETLNFGTLLKLYFFRFLKPCPAEPVYTLPSKTV